MPIASNLTTGPYTANGSQTAFAFTFTVVSGADVQVQVNGVVQSSSLYTVTVNPSGTGTVTFSTPPANGASVLLVSNPDFAQETVFETEGAYSLAQINTVNRRDAVRTNWLAGLINRLIPAGWATPSNLAGKFLAFDAGGNPVVASGTGADGALRADIAAPTGSSLVAFGQFGTGAVPETVQAALRRTVFASQYSTPQAAIDALPNTGGVVIVDAMFNVTDLRVNGTARNKQNVTLRGYGWGTGFRMPNGGMTNASRTNLLDMEGAVNCVVENMTLDGNRANQTIPPLTDGPDYEKFNLVYMEATADCAVLGCNIINAAVIGVNPGAPWVGKTGSDRVRVSGNTFRNSKNPIAAMRIRRGTFESNTLFGVFADEDYGIVVDEFSTGCLVSNNDISDMGDVGIFLFRASDCVVQGNRVTNCLVSIALNDASNDNVVIGNECDDAQNTHIQLKNDCRRNKIRNNDLTTAAQYCIVLEAGTGGSAFNEIVGNTCRLASFSNIAVFDAAFTQIEGNRCSEAAGSGIYMQGACDWSEVNDNYCFNNSTGSANDAGIRLVGQNNITVEDNKCFDSQGTKTQNWGIRCNESFVGSVTIIGNDVRQNKTAGMVITGGTPIVKFNLGWVTEAMGQVTLGAAATAVTVTHGMNMPPNLQSVRVTLYDATVRSTRALYVGNVGATTFEIRADVAPGADTLITWEAKSYV